MMLQVQVLYRISKRSWPISFGNLLYKIRLLGRIVWGSAVNIFYRLHNRLRNLFGSHFIFSSIIVPVHYFKRSVLVGHMWFASYWEKIVEKWKMFYMHDLESWVSNLRKETFSSVGIFLSTVNYILKETFSTFPLNPPSFPSWLYFLAPMFQLFMDITKGPENNTSSFVFYTFSWEKRGNKILFPTHLARKRGETRFCFLHI